MLKSVVTAIVLSTTAAAFAALPLKVGDQLVPSLAPMLEAVTPAVVNISTEGRVKVPTSPLMNDPFFRRFFNLPNQQRERKTQSLGSGVIVDAARGLVLTNNHVIANADQITVKLRDGRELQAELVGSDPDTDVAVIKIPPKNLTAIPLADSEKLRVGDFVVAIGNPFGLGQTVTSGIISALARSGLGITGYEDLIQTDASINPGNSGGALVNLSGELVGINTAIYSQSGGNIGIGFAIPINMAQQITEQLVEYGEVRRGFLGAQLQDLDPNLAEAFGIKTKRGAVLVNVVAGSPAAKSGLQPGDVITRVNGKELTNAASLRNEIGLMRVGEKVELEYIRDGKRRTLSTAVGERETISEAAQGIRNKRLAGASFGNIPTESPAYGRILGVMLFDVERGSRVWEAGLRRGDIITSVNRQPVRELNEFLNLVTQIKGQLLLRVRRGDRASYMVVK
ncbi:MAG: DegQ family serine endoprotease [Pseudomonadota bacterium]